jgi:hypothetical protein
MLLIPSIWIWLGITACVVQSALFAGLNLAVFSVSRLRLQVEADGGNADAARVLALRKDSNGVACRWRTNDACCPSSIALRTIHFCAASMPRARNG